MAKGCLWDSQPDAALGQGATLRQRTLAWSGVCRPIWPNVQAVALFKWSSVSSANAATY